MNQEQIMKIHLLYRHSCTVNVIYIIKETKLELLGRYEKWKITSAFVVVQQEYGGT
jgi:hypothetical protein